MKLRSMLFVPADSERKLAKAITSGSDALILDLEDAVAESKKSVARDMAADYIRSEAPKLSSALFVRINPLDEPRAMADLATVCVSGLAGVMVPKIRDFADIERVGYCLDALEARAGIASGTVKIVPVATETPEAILRMHAFRTHPRLAGITWGAEDLSVAIGAVSNRDENASDFAPLYVWASSLCLVSAAAANAVPIDTLYANFRDEPGLKVACQTSRRRGFRGRIAIHPDQVSTINDAYTPTHTELAHARRIVDAFASKPDSGTLSIDGAMIDRPHYLQALQTLGAV